MKIYKKHYVNYDTAMLMQAEHLMHNGKGDYAYEGRDCIPCPYK